MKPAEKKQKYSYGGMNSGRPVTPPRNKKKKDVSIVDNKRVIFKIILILVTND